MLIKVYSDVNEFEEFSLEVTNIKEVFSGLKMLKDEDFTNNIINNQYLYLLQESSESKPLLLTEEAFTSELNGIEILHIVPAIEGKDPFSIGLAIGWALTDIGLASAGAFVLGNAAIIGSIAMVGLSMALNGIMQLLSPTTSFANDPAASQQKQSSLFNGAPVIREQGGSVPLWYGESYAGGVLISSSLSTAEG